MQNCISDKWLKLVVKNNLVDQFKQTWTSMIENSSKGDKYKLFKHDLNFEDIQIDSEIHHLSFFRCIGYKSDFPFLYYANAQLLSVVYGLKS
jgi:hypothetical protein